MLKKHQNGVALAVLRWCTLGKVIVITKYCARPGQIHVNLHWSQGLP